VWNDPRLAIDWPLDALRGTPDLAAKDAAAPRLEEALRA
jgi:dTDP-4-dehydrorhamnose 3,5-epimerase-like enzyme